MKTDISIYDFLALGPEAFRILTNGRTLEGAYAFRSLTFKNIERRLDGLYEPIDHDGPAHLIEFQATPNRTAWYNLLTKLGLFGEEHPERDVRGWLIVFRRADLPSCPTRIGRDSDLAEAVCLEEFLPECFARQPDNPYLAALAPLIITRQRDIQAQAPRLWQSIQQAALDPEIRERLSALLEYWFMERFRTQSIQEIRHMLHIQTPLQETRAYREIFAEGAMEGKLEGKLEGKIEGKLDSLNRLLTRRFGTLPDWAQQQLTQADHHQLDTWLDQLFEATSLEQLLRHD